MKSLREEECLFFKSRNISEGESGRVGHFLARLLRLRLSQSARNAFCRMPSYYYADHRACSHIFRAGPLFRGGRKTAGQVNIANRCIVANGNSISRPNDPTWLSVYRSHQLIFNFSFLSAFEQNAIMRSIECRELMSLFRYEIHGGRNGLSRFLNPLPSEKYIGNDRSLGFTWPSIGDAFSIAVVTRNRCDSVTITRHCCDWISLHLFLQECNCPILDRNNLIYRPIVLPVTFWSKLHVRCWKKRKRGERELSDRCTDCRNWQFVESDRTSARM